MTEGGIAVGAEIFAGFGGKLDGIQNAINGLGVKPVHRSVGGSAISNGTSPLLIATNSAPSDGRVWNILKAGLFGSDPHTPLGIGQATSTGGLVASGSVTSPAANANIVFLSLPPGTYQIYAATMASGTLAAGDNNNMRLRNATANTNIVNSLILDATTANVPFINGPFVITLTATQTLVVQVIAAGTASSVYTATISAIPVSVSVFADVYTGQVPDPQMADFNSVILSAQDIPSVTQFSRHVEWAKSGEYLFALAYNVPANQQVVLTGRVAEYPVAAVEALAIG